MLELWTANATDSWNDIFTNSLALKLRKTPVKTNFTLKATEILNIISNDR